MNQFKPQEVQQQAIQARLNYFIGADEYDRLFSGFEILHIENRVLTLSVRPACAVRFRINIRGTSLSLSKHCCGKRSGK
jgi:hypothetical protein